MGDGSELDQRLFSFNADSDGQSLEAQLRIEMAEADWTMLGEHVVRVIETSPHDPTDTFETIITITVEHKYKECLQAELEI